jgi:hypothetical protein
MQGCNGYPKIRSENPKIRGFFIRKSDNPTSENLKNPIRKSDPNIGKSEKSDPNPEFPMKFQYLFSVVKATGLKSPFRMLMSFFNFPSHNVAIDEWLRAWLE